MRKRLRIEVVYALPKRQVVIVLEVEEGATILTAIERSGILQQFPEVDPRRDGVGVFGKRVTLDTSLREKGTGWKSTARSSLTRKRRGANGRSSRGGDSGSPREGGGPADDIKGFSGSPLPA